MALFLIIALTRSYHTEPSSTLWTNEQRSANEIADIPKPNSITFQSFEIVRSRRGTPCACGCAARSSSRGTPARGAAATRDEDFTRRGVVARQLDDGALWAGVACCCRIAPLPPAAWPYARASVRTGPDARSPVHHTDGSSAYGAGQQRTRRFGLTRTCWPGCLSSVAVTLDLGRPRA
jgi:hypothetical protein